MIKEIRPALVLLVALTAITGLAYPLAMTGVARTLFPYQAEGSLLHDKDGKVIGSALIGQSFADARYFHGRLSATTEPDPKDPTKTVPTPYAADSSAGSNLGPTNKALIDRVQGDMDKLGPRTPTGSSPPISSPPRPPVSTRISRPKRPPSRCRVSPRRATFRPIRSGRSSTRPFRAEPSGSSASPASTCWRSTWPSTRSARNNVSA